MPTGDPLGRSVDVNFVRSCVVCLDVEGFIAVFTISVELLPDDILLVVAMENVEEPYRLAVAANND